MPKVRAMFAPSGNRAQAIGAFVLLVLIAILHSLQTPSSSHLSPLSIRRHQQPLSATTRNGVKSPRIKKVTALFGETNHLYEAALQTHQRHNELHGYEMQVLRERIHVSYLSKPAYLMSVLVEELAKPWDERVQWLVWVDPDTIILNPQIPLELFIPPPDEEIHLVGTHDESGFNGGVFFLRVDPWSLELLVNVLAVPLTDKKHHVSLAKDHTALEQIIEGPRFLKRVTYQPRTWFNAFDVNKTFEGHRGDLLVHFPDVSADKWVRMDAYLGNVTAEKNAYEMPLGETNYQSDVGGFWYRMREARKLLKEAQGEEKNDVRVRETVRRVKFALEYETDHEEVFKESLAALHKALTERL